MIQDELEELAESWLRIGDDVFVSDDVDGDLRIEPEIVKVFPDGDILLDEFRPKLWELLEVVVADRLVVGSSADHVEKTGDAVERVPDEEDGSLRVELGLSVPLRVVRFNDPHAFVD